MPKANQTVPTCKVSHVEIGLRKQGLTPVDVGVRQLTIAVVERLLLHVLQGYLRVHLQRHHTLTLKERIHELGLHLLPGQHHLMLNLVVLHGHSLAANLTQAQSYELGGSLIGKLRQSSLVQVNSRLLLE